jgi:hypothetical protein
MVKAGDRSVAEQIKEVPAPVRPIVQAARDAIKSVAPNAEEVPYHNVQPKSKTMMWKLAHYKLNGEEVVGFGTFTNHSALFFYRGRELDDPGGLLQGSGKDSRFVTLRAPEDAKSPAVTRLLRQAFKLSKSSARAETSRAR